MFRLLPERDEIARGLLGANVIGFHTYDYARHFINSVLRTLGIHMREGIAELSDHRSEVGTFPIGIDADSWHELAVSQAAEERIRELRAHFGERKIILGVERLDYTKGIPLKLQAGLTIKSPEIGPKLSITRGSASRLVRNNMKG